MAADDAHACESHQMMLAAAVVAAACLAAQSPNAFEQDFDFAVRKTAGTYAYFDAKATRWSDVAGLYRSDLRAVKTARRVHCPARTRRR